MLDFMRRNKESFFVKFIMAFIILSFVVFFGSDTLRSGGAGTSASPAEVNGVAVNGKKALYQTAVRMDQFPGKMEPARKKQFREFIYAQVVNSLINEELMNQNLYEMGITVSKKELQKDITSKKISKKGDHFDKDYYFTRFLPWYLKSRGVPFEKDVRETLTREKVFGLMRSVFEPSAPELKKFYKLQNTSYVFSVIKVRKEKINLSLDDKNEPLPKELDGKKDTDDKAAQKKLATSLYKKWKAGQKLDKDLKDNKLKQRKTQKLFLTRLKSVFDGSSNTELVKKLLKLSKKTPFLDDVVEEGRYFYLVKLEESNTPKEKPEEKDLNRIKDLLQTNYANSLASAWVQDLRSRAEIDKN